MTAHWSAHLPRKACTPALKWCRRQPSAAAAWRECQNGSWMMWLLGRLSGPVGSRSLKRLVLCACAVARQALQYAPADEHRPRLAIEAAERYARGEDATLDDVRAAAAGANEAYIAIANEAYIAIAAANRAGICAAAGAQTAAAYAFAPDAFLRTGDTSVYAASAAGYYAYDAAATRAYTDAADKSLAASADIVRAHYPRAPRLPT